MGGDKVDLDFDFLLYFWKGKREGTGKASVYRGPILLAFSRLSGVSDAPASRTFLDHPGAGRRPVGHVELPTPRVMLKSTQGIF